MALSLRERIKNCIIALNLPQKEVESILSAEFTRIAYDERTKDKKGVIIQVDGDVQKVIAENMVRAYMDKTVNMNLCQTGKGKVEVRVGNDVNNPEDSVGVINLSKFEFEVEKQKLIDRYNDTIISNSKIKDHLIKSESTVVDKPGKSNSQSEIREIEAGIKELTDELVKSEFSVFSFFKGKKIKNCKEEIRALEERLSELQEKNSNDDNPDKNAKDERIKNINDKEENMKGIKFMFTGKRESLIKHTSLEGKVFYEFVLDKDQPDNILLGFEQLINYNKSSNPIVPEENKDDYGEK